MRHLFNATDVVVASDGSESSVEPLTLGRDVVLSDYLTCKKDKKAQQVVVAVAKTVVSSVGWAFGQTLFYPLNRIKMIDFVHLCARRCFVNPWQMLRQPIRLKSLA